MTSSHLLRACSPIAVVLALAIPQIGAAQGDINRCPTGGGTGASLINENGIAVPFGANYCQQKPIVHAYSCWASQLQLDHRQSLVDPADAGGDLELWLGMRYLSCESEGSDTQCPLCGENSFFGWCGSRPGMAGEYDAEDGLSAVYTVSAPSPRPVTFQICYWSQEAPSATLKFRLARHGNVLNLQPGPIQTGSPVGIYACLEPFPLLLHDGDYELQVTLYPNEDCDPSPNRELYFGGETENYRLCVGSVCQAVLTKMRSNH